MTGRFLHWLMLVLVLCLPGRAGAQEAPAVREDTSTVVVRTPSEVTLERYRNDPDFVYEEAPEQGGPWWAQVWQWFVENVLEPIFGSVPGVVYRWLLYIGLAVALFFAITRLLQVSPRTLFQSRRRAATVAFDEVGDDIQAVDFDRLIHEAAEAEDYRRAVRLQYLRVLRDLTERGAIAWQRDKTNHEYLNELPAPLRPAFARLTYLFEYVWYGDQPVDAARYERTRRAFAHFEQRMGEQGREGERARGEGPATMTE